MNNNQNHVSPFGEFIEIDQYIAFDKYNFEGQRYMLVLKSIMKMKRLDKTLKVSEVF